MHNYDFTHNKAFHLIPTKDPKDEEEKVSPET
jgi:hypothetical protein